MPKKPEKNNQKCPFCNGKDIRKKGKRKNKLQALQRYKCKSCNKYFTKSTIRNLTYPSKVVLNAVSFYNLGYTLNQATRHIKKKYNLAITPQTILFWLRKFKKQLPYHRIRDRIKTNYKPKDIIKRRIMKHHDQPFNFQYHKAKLELFCNNFPKLKEYIYKIEKNCPNHLFKNSNRISQYKPEKNLNIKTIKKQNYANILADLALSIINNNKKRHEILEKFMLINDTATIAVEIPVFLKSGNQALTGHIDILQIRFNKIHILDFKPGINKATISQLFLYAIALSRRTKIPLRMFRCAYFNNKDYFEFSPKDIFTK